MMDKQKLIILRVLSKASRGAPIGYVEKHLGIADVCKLLNELKDEGYIQLCPPDPWSARTIYIVTEKGYSLLENVWSEAYADERELDVLT